ncbi:MAG TPA: putrescine ABC transporter permease PotH, partial [Devosia sp.]|nr:putrescine ABC transporter permease PotH [Devosia sp.]
MSDKSHSTDTAPSLASIKQPGKWLVGYGRSFISAIPTLWLLVFFLIPFIVVAKISLSEPAIARPPYLPIWEWVDGALNISLNFGNYLFLLDDPLYVNAYIESVTIAALSTV